MNQTPEQLSRNQIDKQLLASGWVIQDKKTFNLSASIGVAHFTDYHDPKLQSRSVFTFHRPQTFELLPAKQNHS